MVSTITPALVELLAKTLNSLKTNMYIIWYKYCMGSCTNHIFETPSPFYFPFTQVQPLISIVKKLGTPKPIKEKYEQTYLFFEDTFDNWLDNCERAGTIFIPPGRLANDLDFVT